MRQQGRDLVLLCMYYYLSISFKSPAVKVSERQDYVEWSSGSTSTSRIP